MTDSPLRSFRTVSLAIIAAIISSPIIVSSPSLPTPTVAAAGGPPTVSGCPTLPADNIWNTRVDQLPVHPSSAAYLSTIGLNTSLRTDFGSGTFDGGPIGIPYVVVPGNQAKVPVSFEYADESDPGPYPVPPNPPIEGGPNSTGDRHILMVDRDNCVLYELYSAYPNPDGTWRAGSGAIFPLGSNGLRPDTWTSADAAGLPILPGLARYDEVAAGEIRHALRFTASVTQRAYVWPARHFASSNTSPTRPPMGTRVRLKADFDVSTYSPANRVILQALKSYGMILADNGSNWFVSGVPDSGWDDDDLRRLRQVVGNNFEVVDQSPLMIHPDSGQARQTGASNPTSTAPLAPSTSTPTLVASGPTATRVPSTSTPTFVAASTATRTATSVAPNAVVGGRGLAIGSDAAGVRLSWQGGNAQTGYSVARLAGGVLNMTHATVAASATEYVDTSAPPGLDCYALVVSAPSPSNPSGTHLSDLECAYVGFRSPTSAPQGFTLKLNQSSIASFTWGPPSGGGSDGYLLAQFGGGSVPLGASVSSASAPANGLTCFAVGATQGGALLGYSDLACGWPDFSTLGA